MKTDYKKLKDSITTIKYVMRSYLLYDYFVSNNLKIFRAVVCI